VSGPSTSAAPPALVSAPDPLGRALAIALAALDSVRDLFRVAERVRPSAEYKGDGSPVTDVDREIERRLRNHLTAYFPDVPILGEELSDHEGAPRVAAQYEWVIDPIDGTVGFVHGVPLAAILLCLRAQGQPVVAVADFPALGRRLHAVRGRGTYEDGQLVRVREGFDPERDIVCHGDPYTFELSGYQQWLAIAGRSLKFFRSYTDAFGHYLVARGSASVVLDAAMEDWDLAATQLLVEEAGGVVVSFPDRYDPRRRTVISGGRVGVQWMRSLLEPLPNFLSHR
jgi:histidinol-phosphatase